MKMKPVKGWAAVRKNGEIDFYLDRHCELPIFRHKSYAAEMNRGRDSKLIRVKITELKKGQK